MMLAHICRLRLAIRGLSGLVTFLVKTVDAWKSRPLMRSQYKSLWINKINSFDGRGGGAAVETARTGAVVQPKLPRIIPSRRLRKISASKPN